VVGGVPGRVLNCGEGKHSESAHGAYLSEDEWLEGSFLT
jgi:hypothetical protein